MWYQNISSMFFVLSQSMRVTDGWRDRQNYDPQDRASIAARSVKISKCYISQIMYMVIALIFAPQGRHIDELV